MFRYLFIVYDHLLALVNCVIFFFNDTATNEIYTYRHTLSLHDALPICSTGPSALPIRIEHTIIMPAVMEPSMTSRAPAPRTIDCNVMRTKRLAVLIRALRSDACV